MRRSFKGLAAGAIRRACYPDAMEARFPSAMLQSLLADAERSPDREICGLLLRDAAGAIEAKATDNVADKPARNFEIDPAILFAALRAERAGGPKLVGHYHSHPNGSAAPSPRDIAAAEPGKLWLILGGNIARLWLAEAASFREMQLVVTDDAAGLRST